MTYLEPMPWQQNERRHAFVYWHSDAFAYHAEIGDYEGTGPRGTGKTKLAALQDLHDLCDDPLDRAAVLFAALMIDPVAGEDAVGAA